MASDKHQPTIHRRLEILQDVLLHKAFYASKGPTIAMTDDSSGELGAIKNCWQDRINPRVVHFPLLQAMQVDIAL